MSGSGGEKTLAVITFLLIGVPTGLCSTLASPFIIGSLFSLRSIEGPEDLVSAFMLGLVWLLGFAIAFFLLRWLTHTFAA